MKIPKRLMHIWIGNRRAPREWMATWRKHHPEWNYTLIDNTYFNSRKFKNQLLIDEYIKRWEYPGAADLIRYEILFEHGGVIAAADSICLKNTDELWDEDCAYTVYENEFVRGKLVSPILACNPGNKFVGYLIDRLGKLRPMDLDEPWKTTGNYFIARMINEYQPDIKIFPSHYFIPDHYTGHRFEGNDKVYAYQLFAETTKSYKMPGILDKLKRKRGRVRSKRMRNRIPRVQF